LQAMESVYNDIRSGSDSSSSHHSYYSFSFRTGEFDPSLSTGLEMFDFHARFYDPQLGRWFTPDPAYQFDNPYLGIGNNPVKYIDPDGEWIGFAIGAGMMLFNSVRTGIQTKNAGSTFLNGFMLGFGTGAA